MYVLAIFTFCEFEQFMKLANEFDDHDPFKNAKVKLGIEFLISGAVHAALAFLSVFFYKKKSNQSILDPYNQNYDALKETLNGPIEMARSIYQDPQETSINNNQKEFTDQGETPAILKEEGN